MYCECDEKFYRKNLISKDNAQACDTDFIAILWVLKLLNNSNNLSKKAGFMYVQASVFSSELLQR